ncbi:MAG: Wzz/FepE/Etk N-terminal domain-containing protein, partial [Chloroflexota bacterium]|nr:Wzz/FepE/Etk N-terminal domain-containing protein [Chloroflexota bacterium]
MEDDLTMDIDLQAYWVIIKRWLWLIVLASLLAGVTAYSVSRWLVEPVYSAAVRLVIQPSSSLSGVNYSDIMAGQRAALTYAEMLKELPLQESALLQLGYTEAQVAAFAEVGFPYEMTVRSVRDTQV